MKKLSILLMIIVLTGVVSVAEVVKIPDIMNPKTISLDRENMYITEGTTVYIFSLKDFSLKKKFGKEGEGPQEFKVFPVVGLKIRVLPDYLMLESLGKLSFFAKDGTFKKETRISTMPLLGNFLPIGDGYVGMRGVMADKKQFIGIFLYDSNLKSKKELIQLRSPFDESVKNINPVTIIKFPFLQVCEDRAFVDGENGNIHVFDKDGKKSLEIETNIERVPLTSADEKRYIDFLTSHPIYKMLYERDKDKVKFPEEFPPLRGFHIADKKVVILTYKVKDGKKEFVIFDINGKLLKKTFVPLQEINAAELYPYTTQDGNLYQLIENQETETWELHIDKIM